MLEANAGLVNAIAAVENQLFDVSNAVPVPPEHSDGFVNALVVGAGLPLDLSDLHTGVYFFSLLVDGKVMSTKRLVLQN